MGIQRNILVAPPDNAFYAAFAVAMSTFVFAYSTIFGSISILFYYLLWFTPFVIDPRRVIGRLSDLVLPAAFAILAVSSVFWSDASAVTLRAGIQLVTHVVCAMIATRVVNVASLLWGMLLGCFLVILYSLAFGRSAYDFLDGSYTFVGAFGSKNQLALYCSLGIYSSLSIVLAVRTSRAGICVAMMIAVVLVATLMASRSATAILSMLAVVVLLPTALVLLRFDSFVRNALLALILFPVLCVGLIGFMYFGAADMILAAFGKDPTLTGRTELWEEGLAVAAQRPLLGVGFQAYWVQGFPDAERLWDQFYITTRTGFHFHNTYVEVLVELGWVGLVLFIIILLSTAGRIVGRILLFRDSEAAVLLGFFALLLIRSISEVDALYQYTTGMFLLVYLYISARRRPILSALRKKNSDAIGSTARPGRAVSGTTKRNST